MPSCHPKRSLLISSGASHKSQAQWLARHPDPTHRLSNHAKNTNGLGQWGPHWLFVASSFPILCTSGATINTGRLCRSVRKVVRKVCPNIFLSCCWMKVTLRSASNQMFQSGLRRWLLVRLASRLPPSNIWAALTVGLLGNPDEGVCQFYMH